MSRSITIDDLDEVTVARLEGEARRRGIGVAAVAREALTRGLPPAVGVSRQRGGAIVYDDLDPLAGTWSDADGEAFRSATAGLSRVDEDLWK